MSDLAELLIKDLSETMRTTLAPFIERMEHTDKQYKMLVTIMNSMPEFQRIMDENNLLKEELRRQTESILAAPTLAPPTLAPPTLALHTIIEPSIPVRLEITSLTDSIVNAFDVTEHVKEIYDTFNTEDVVSAEEVADEEVASEVEVSEVDASEEDASEADASEADASEADASDADASEADEEEEEASEAAVEESDEDEDEEEAACVAVEEEEASEAEASEAEASEADEEEEACVAVEEEADEEEEVFIVEIDDVEYYTSDDVNGVIYSVDANEEVGEKVGQFIDGEPTFI